MDVLLEKFLEDQKTKLAEEKACLEQEPPYMEMRRQTGHILQKDNMPSRTSQQDGVSLPLREQYERKKHKLQEELRNDYRKYMAEKDHWDAVDIHTVPERRRTPRTVRVRDVATLTEGGDIRERETPGRQTEEGNCTQRQDITRANYSTETECRHQLRPKPTKDLYLRPVRTQFAPLDF
uniref:Uncharacterized protein n=1 Tax=Cyprinus carpio TaxID=7962 RepID=A0A8C2BGB0_CYPCA